MKTKIEIADELFFKAKKFAENKHVTLNELIEQGLQLILADSWLFEKPPFRLANASVHGGSLLLPDSKDWQQFDEEHLVSTLNQRNP